MKSRFFVGLCLAAIAAPAGAGALSGASLLKLAQLVLQNRALLERGQSGCGEAAALKPQDTLLMTAAGAALGKAIPAARLDALNLVAGRKADIAARAPGFCANAITRKPALLGGVANAARQFGVGGDPGGLGAAALLGGGTGDGGAAGAIEGLLRGH